MITCTRRLQFCAGHRVMGHENKCAMLHGHNYVVHITAQAALDSIGRVIDFSVLKEKVGGWIDYFWDHGFIVYEHDEPALTALRNFAGDARLRQKIYHHPTNPTAENMAHHLLTTICPYLLDSTGVRVTSVVVEETENCKAEAAL